MVRRIMTAKKARIKADEEPISGCVEPSSAMEGLSPITDKRSYDIFIKTISLRIYAEFEKAMRDEGIEKPELSLVGLDLKKAVGGIDLRMANYIALVARLATEKAFVDRYAFASSYMPGVIRHMEEDGSSDVSGYLEGKLQRDIMMEIRSIALQRIPEGERFSYRHKLKVL
jgi:hypothetical protein